LFVASAYAEERRRRVRKAGGMWRGGWSFAYGKKGKAKGFGAKQGAPCYTVESVWFGNPQKATNDRGERGAQGIGGKKKEAKNEWGPPNWSSRHQLKKKEEICGGGGEMVCKG